MSSIKTSIRNWFLLAVVSLAMAGQLAAQTLRTLHNFGTMTCCPYLNSDGANPNVSILSGNTLYGTAIQGGSGGSGTVFKVNTDGTGFVTLHSFTERQWF